MKIIRKIWILYAILSLLLFWLFLSIDPFYLAVPKDSELIEVLNSHHDELNKLQAMLFKQRIKLEDGSIVRLGRINPSEIDHRLPDQQRKEYRDLVSKIQGLKHITIFVFDEEEKNYTVEFTFAYSGAVAFFLNRFWKKGIIYTNLDKGMTVSDEPLDDPSNVPDGAGVLRKISPSWYIFLSKSFKV